MADFSLSIANNNIEILNLLQPLFSLKIITKQFKGDANYSQIETNRRLSKKKVEPFEFQVGIMIKI